MRFERYGNVGMPGTVGVAWLCPQCDKRSLDLCPMHTELPSPGMCLNCASALEGADACLACGVARSPLVAAITDTCGAPPALAAALELIDRGLIRLAANAIDLRLEQVPDDNDTWLAKAEMLGEHGVDLLRRAIAREPERLALHVALYGLLGQRKDQAGAIAALDGALPLATGSQRAHLQHVKAELCCTLERGEEGLEAIDEALLDDPSSPRRHYVRGWALGMLGQLEQARAAMRRVLELQPGEPSAVRALAQLDQALADGS
jgi:tetratricopeptide (TPR) repeat protein